MITRFLYNALAFVYNRNNKDGDESSAYWSGLTLLSIPISMLLLGLLRYFGYQIKAFTGTRLDAIPFYVLLLLLLRLTISKKRVRQHAQITSKTDQNIGFLLYCIWVAMSFVALIALVGVKR